MRRSPFLFLNAIIITSLLVSCKGELWQSPETRYVNRQPLENFIKEVPVEVDGRWQGNEDRFYQLVNKRAYELQLDSLEGGYDSLQIRIWLGHSMALKRQVVVLKTKGQVWKGQLVTYTLDERHSVVQKTIQSVSPASGWPLFIDSVFRLGLLSLPNETEVKGYNGCSGDGIVYKIEWATENRYRFYRYCNPEDNVENFWQARHVLQLADFLEKELGFNYIK